MRELNDKEIYLLKGTCIPIIGYNRGIIYNLVDKTYYYIPKKYILKLGKSRIINKNLFSEEAITFFTDKNLIIKVLKNQINQFPQVKPEYVPKKDIEHVIIEVAYSKLDILKQIVLKLNKFQIRSLEFVITTDPSLESNNHILNFLRNEKNIPTALNFDYEIYLKLKDKLDLSSFEYIKQYSYYGSEILSRRNNIYHYADVEYWKMTQKKLFFNVDFFAESLYKHSVFNKMLFIDANGKVKQTPLGNVIFSYTELNRNTLENLNTGLFWNMTKDKCDVCKDCEYRYMCIDARLPVREKESMWYFASECNYNPYISEWKGEGNWISVEQWRKENQKF